MKFFSLKKPCFKVSITRQIAQARQFIIALSLVSFAPMVSAGIITEDFTGGVFDTNNFELGNAYGSGTGSAASGAYQGINRGTLRTVNDNLFGTLADPLTVQADLTFTNWDIAFLSIRSTGLPADGNKEPSDGLFLRIHNDHGNGQINVAEGGNYGYFQTTPTSGTSFFDSTVRVSLTDYGNSIDVSFLNLLSLEQLDFTVNSSYSSSLGHVSFSSTTAAWDNISIGHSNLGASASTVPEPSILAIMALGFVGMGLVRKKVKVINE